MDEVYGKDTMRHHRGRFAPKASVALMVSMLLVLGYGALLLAAVVIADFYVQAGDQEIYVYWETGSELGNLGFYVWRSENVNGPYEKLPLGQPQDQFIPSDDFGAGAFYEFVDVQVTPGILYYYKVQDIPSDGSTGEFVGPESAGINVAPPDTPTPTATPSPTPTSSPVGQPTAPPEASVLFWADPTELNAGECSTVQWQTNHVRAVYLDGAGVSGLGAKTFCPCYDETHTLYVTYLDGQSELFSVTLDVTGTCPGSPPTPISPISPLGSPTPQPTLSPGKTPAAIPTPTVMAVSPATPEPTPLPSVPSSAFSPVETPVLEVTDPGTGAREEIGETPSKTEDVSAVPGEPVADMPVILGTEAASRPRLVTGMWLGLSGVLGLGLIAGGIWLWRRS